MADAFIGEIRIFGGNYPPNGWALCNGQILPIQQNTALFSLLGTTYGGDGRRTFALPNLAGRMPIGVGQGPGLSDHYWGETGGSASTTLSQQQIPTHSHVPMASTAVASSNSASNAVLARAITPNPPYHAPDNLQALGPGALGASGGSQAHNNLQPYLELNFIIALYGVYPPRG